MAEPKAWKGLEFMNRVLFGKRDIILPRCGYLTKAWTEDSHVMRLNTGMNENSLKEGE